MARICNEGGSASGGYSENATSNDYRVYPRGPLEDRLPPVDINHVDVSALLQELSLLRSEVKAVAQLREEIVELRNSLDCLKAQCLTDTNLVSYDKDFPSLHATRQQTVNLQRYSFFISSC